MVSIEKRKEVGCVISQAMLTKNIDMLFSASHGNGDSKHAIAKSIPSRTKATMFYYSKVNRRLIHLLGILQWIGFDSAANTF